ncbi:MAG: hypothetical protein HYY95_27640 [Candidatus Rokubacteria bacterium]|nr:hypothetical protein [Candidatus Rokubacteria bacterium]MBI3109302.1 hypothetical protein [Candidatus Rokubacteria bacterium]
MAVLEAIKQYLTPRSAPTALPPAERLARQRRLAAERHALTDQKGASVERHAPRLAAARQEVDQARAQLEAATLRLGDVSRAARGEAFDLDRNLTAVEHELRTLADPAIADFLADLQATAGSAEEVGLKVRRSIGWEYDHRRLGPVQVQQTNSAELSEVFAEFRAVRREVEGLALEPIAQDELLARLATYQERLIAFAAARGFRVLWQRAA